MLNITVRPVATWPGKETAYPKGSLFKNGYKVTIGQLEDELNKAGFIDGSAVLEMFVEPREIRLDGKLRADARVKKHGVILRFSRKTGKIKTRPDGQRVYETQDVSYPCDAFDDWQDNLRAIMLSMEALRRVERYGVFKYDEIISRLALPSAEGRTTTVQDAAAFIASHSGYAMKDIIADPETRAAAYKKAATELHPDRGGDHEKFLKLQESLRIVARGD